MYISNSMIGKYVKLLSTPFLLISIFGLLISCSKPPKEGGVVKSKKDGIKVKFQNSIATVDPMGGSVKAKGAHGGRSFRLIPSSRVESSSHVQVYMDGGTRVLLDKGTVVVPKMGTIKLDKGRVWFMIKQEKPFNVVFNGGKITARDAAFSLEINAKGATLFHIRGELNFHGKKTVQLTGGTFLLAGGVAKSNPKELWIDWTGGVSREKAKSVGYGTLYGHSSGVYGLGTASTPLILRRQNVMVKVRRTTSVTTVEQTFFNPASYKRDGEYRVILPKGASILSVSILKEKTWISGNILPVVTGHYFLGDGTFYFMGNGLFGANIANMPISGEVGIRFSYVEKLTEIHGRKLYRYSMSGGEKCGEFELGMRIMIPGSNLRTGWNGKWENQKFIVRKSDFFPRSDFVAEIFPEKKGEAIIEVVDGKKKNAPYLLSIPLKTVLNSKGFKKTVKKDGISIVLLLDMSGSIGSAKIHLIKTSFASLLEKFSPKDRLAVFVLNNDLLPLDGEGLKLVTPARAKKMMENLSRLVPGGATDIGKALETAAIMIPMGEGTIIYLGDGQPSRGAMLTEDLRARLEMASPSPVFRAVLVGDNARSDLLEPLGRIFAGNSVAKLARLFNLLFEEAARSNFKGLQVKLGSKARRITPVKSQPLGIDDTYYSMGFVTTPVPDKVTLKGWYNGRFFTKEIGVKVHKSPYGDMLKKLWAYSRVDDFIAKGAGFEAITSLAREYGIVTPYTALSFLYSGSIFKNAVLPASIWDELPRLTVYKNALLKSLPPSSISGIGLPDIRPTHYKFSMQGYYKQLLERPQRREAISECYNRRAIFQPRGGGMVTYEFEIDMDGKLKKFKRTYSSITDKKMVQCIHRAISVMPKLPPPPTGEVIKFTHAYSFSSTGNIVPQKCSKLAKSYISKRRRVWRQKLGGYVTAYKGETLWKNAKAGCELSGWIYKKALIDIILVKLRTISKKLRFASLMTKQGWSVTRYIRGKILKSVDSPYAARLVVLHYNLNGGDLLGKLMVELRKWYLKDGQKLKAQERYLKIKEFAAKFHVFDPANAPLTLFYARYAWLSGSKDLALTLAEGLIPRRDLTAGQRADLAEFLAKAGKKRIATVVISTGVELAPYDPLTRKKLGDFFMRYDLNDDALAEYNLLTWLLPQAVEPKILMASTRIERGETELGLRIFENLMLSKGNKLGRLLLEKNLAAIYSGKVAGIKDIKAVRARIRRNGLLSDEGKTLIFFKQKQGKYLDAKYRIVEIPLEKETKKGKKKDEIPLVWLRWPNQQANLGLRIIELSKRHNDIKLRFSVPRGDGITYSWPANGELVVITNLWKKNQKVFKYNIDPKPGTRTVFTVGKKGELSKPSVLEIKVKKKKKK
jgi:von Willebrand factor type A domain